MNGLDPKTEETITRAHNARLEPLAGREEEQCAKCLGWGFVLGTDTEDTFGQVCPCGCDIHRPMSPAEHAALQRAHDRARANRR